MMGKREVCCVCAFLFVCVAKTVCECAGFLSMCNCLHGVERRVGGLVL